MKKCICLLLLFSVSFVFSQRDSIPLGTKYREDQIYLSVLYNQLYDQPNNAQSSGFSFGLNIGFIRDIPLHKEGKWALGLGLGYGYDSFNQSLIVTSQNNQNNFQIDPNGNQNEMRLHAIEVPFELRWRNSNAKKYKFWRFYPGIKFSYNFQNTFYRSSQTGEELTSNVDEFRNLQYGLTLSAGYDAFNVHLYYGLTSLFENATVNGQSLDTKIIRLGLIIYIL